MNKKQAYSLTFSEKEKRWFLFYYLGGQRKGTRAPRHLTKAEQLEAWAKEFVRERQASEGILGRAPTEVPKGPTVRGTYPPERAQGGLVAGPPPSVAPSGGLRGGERRRGGVRRLPRGGRQRFELRSRERASRQPRQHVRQVVDRVDFA